MLKIRLMRIGAKKRPFYRVVVIDERSKRSGEYIELLGTYNPLTNPHEINLKQDRIDHWTKQGAQMSDGFLRIIGKAPQRPARKSKKEKKEEPAPAATPVEKSKTPVEETKLETDETNQEVKGSIDEGVKTSPSEPTPEGKPVEETPAEESTPADEPTSETKSTPEEK